MEIKKIIEFTICPSCHKSGLFLKKGRIFCRFCHKSFEIIEGVPILIDSDSSNIQEGRQKIWFEKHYAKFSKTEYVIEDWRESMLERIFSNIPLRKIRKYLDIGCGATGYTAIEAAKRNNWISFGVDISLEAMIRARALAQKEGVGQKTGFIVCSAENLPFKSGSFDFVSAISVLEHLEFDQKIIESASRILKNNGLAYICVPNSYRKIWFFLWPIYYYFDKKIGHKRHYSIKNLDKKMKQAEFRNIKYFYNAHLEKLSALILKKFNLINDEQWWRIERRDFSLNQSGIQLNAFYKKEI